MFIPWKQASSDFTLSDFTFNITDNEVRSLFITELSKIVSGDYSYKVSGTNVIVLLSNSIDNKNIKDYFAKIQHDADVKRKNSRTSSGNIATHVTSL